jgi:hypothetical protein
MPTHKWLLERRDFVVNEIGLLIPSDFSTRSKRLPTPEAFEEAHSELTCIPVLARHRELRLLRAMYLYGLFVVDGRVNWGRLQTACRMDCFAVDAIRRFGSAVLSECATVEPALMRFCVPIAGNTVDVSWIDPDARAALAHQLELLFALRERSPPIDFSPGVWQDGPGWWGPKYDHALVTVAQWHGFCSFGKLAAVLSGAEDAHLREIIAIEELTLTPNPLSELPNFAPIAPIALQAARLRALIPFLVHQPPMPAGHPIPPARPRPALPQAPLPAGALALSRRRGGRPPQMPLLPSPLLPPQPRPPSASPLPLPQQLPQQQPSASPLPPQEQLPQQEQPSAPLPLPMLSPPRPQPRPPGQLGPPRTCTCTLSCDGRPFSFKCSLLTGRDTVMWSIQWVECPAVIVSGTNIETVFESIRHVAETIGVVIPAVRATQLFSGQVLTPPQVEQIPALAPPIE